LISDTGTMEGKKKKKKNGRRGDGATTLIA
jgi:hypothetical protein